MHAHECRRVEPVGESVEAAAYLVGHRAGVDDHMIVGGLQPVDLVGADRHDATLVPHEYATQGGAGALLALEHVRSRSGVLGRRRRDRSALPRE